MNSAHDIAPARPDALLREARQRIAPEDAILLLAHALQRSVSWLYAHGDEPVDGTVAAGFRDLVERRSAGEPVAYLTGRRGFWTLDLMVSGDTLIPRPDSERLVELALERLPAEAPCRVLDLGTGSGAIALALASERPKARVLATDRSAGALEVARRNAQVHRLPNVEFAAGDWYAPVAGERFDLIASNPPYIAMDDVHLGQGDLRFEPRGALASGRDGLDALRTIAAGAPGHLRSGGWLLVEHGFEQGSAVRELLSAAGFGAVHTAQDLEERERVTLGQWSGAAGET